PSRDLAHQERGGLSQGAGFGSPGLDHLAYSFPAACSILTRAPFCGEITSAAYLLAAREPPFVRPRKTDRGIVALPDPLTTCSAEDLLARFSRGQTDAFGVLVRRYERELFGYLRRYVGSSDLAEDVFQNTFLQLYSKIDQYEPGRPVRPWLYTI